MEKEKILQQLEDKLLPSVQNLENGRAEEHDFFPSLLWMLLEKSKESNVNFEQLLKGSKALLEATPANITKAAETTQNVILQDNTEVKAQLEVIKQSNVNFEQLLKGTALKSNEDIKKLAGFISNTSEEQFKKITMTIVENNKASQERTNALIENKVLFFNQKIEEIKNYQLKTERKFVVWFLALSIFQIISITGLAIILMR